MLYFRLFVSDPNSCGPTVNIGEIIDSIANQAFVLFRYEPFTVFRTFIINCTSLGLSVFWLISSVIIISKLNLLEITSVPTSYVGSSGGPVVLAATYQL